MGKIPVALLGATGAVGQRFVSLLADHPQFSLELLMASGAKTAGISGCGPATVILTEPDNKEDIMVALEGKGEIISTKINYEKAGII